jgi:hypothetical protein
MEMSDVPNIAKSRSYSILHKGGQQEPDRGVILNTLEKSVRDGNIDPLVLTNYELTGQLGAEGRAVLAQEGLI